MAGNLSYWGPCLPAHLFFNEGLKASQKGSTAFTLFLRWSGGTAFFFLLFAASARCMEELRSRKQDHTKAKAGLDCLVTLQPSIPSINPYIHFYRIISLSWCIYYTFQNKCTSNQSSDISLRIINISIFIYLIRFKNIYYSFRPVYKTLPACSLVLISQN